MSNEFQPPADHLPPNPDISNFASALQKAAQTFLCCVQTSEANAQDQPQQHFDAVPSSPASLEATPDSGSQEPFKTPTKDLPSASQTKETALDIEDYLSFPLTKKDKKKAHDKARKLNKCARRKIVRDLYEDFYFAPFHLARYADKAILHTFRKTFGTEKFRDEIYSTEYTERAFGRIFKKAYAQGYFHDEIRYYFVSAQTVESEYKFLARHQQKDIPSLLSSVYDDLNLKIKFMAGTDKETGSPQDLSLAQLGESMLQHLKTLHAIHVHLARTPLVHKTRLPNYPAEKMDPESRVE